MQTVVFTDIVDSTEYVRQVGDQAGRAAVRQLEQRVASLAKEHGGRVVKNLGDGSLISFSSNSSAITFALELQEASGDGPLYLRVGMTAGEPIQEDGDIHGIVVNHASRIGELGDAGEVIVSDIVRQLAEGKGFTFVAKDEVSLKGFVEPERVWKATKAPAGEYQSTVRTESPPRFTVEISAPPGPGNFEGHKAAYFQNAWVINHSDSQLILEFTLTLLEPEFPAKDLAFAEVKFRDATEFHEVYRQAGDGVHRQYLSNPLSIDARASRMGNLAFLRPSEVALIPDQQYQDWMIEVRDMHTDSVFKIENVGQHSFG